MSGLDPRIINSLLPAYEPCRGFDSKCAEMRWEPSKGHVPRGFCGAAGEVDEVELVLVTAEPGDPYQGEDHSGDGSSISMFKSAYDHETGCVLSGTDQYFKNVRRILHLCWPKIEITQQLRKVWITDSVLCSAKIEGGRVSSECADECAQRFLISQLRLFPKALVVALGGKAQKRLRGLTPYLSVFSPAPPGCNYKGASESWKAIAEWVHLRKA